MAGDWQEFALEKAELFSRRLRDLLSSGQGYVRAQFGMDLGLKPEMYPTWVMLTTAAVGLVLLLGLSGAAVCGWLLPGRKRRSPVTPSAREPGKARLTKTAKPEEQKRRIKRKITEKVHCLPHFVKLSLAIFFFLLLNRVISERQFITDVLPKSKIKVTNDNNKNVSSMLAKHQC